MNSERTALRLFVSIACAVTLARLVSLWLSTTDLFFDEAQYWAWSRELDFGYYSKPPLIAWLIALTTSFCGDGVACVRASAPLMHLGTALVTFAIGRLLYGGNAALWAGLSVLLATGVSYSARVISTDVPLLFFWSLALLAFLKLRAGEAGSWAWLLAVSLGLGLLSKYAMFYFVGCMLLAAWLDRPTRALLRRPLTWGALAGGVAFLIPNIMWNAAHDFPTLRHTVDNARGSGTTFSPSHAVEFLLGQFGIAGPVVFGGLLLIAVRWRALANQSADRVLLAFSLPILAVLTVVAFTTRANANWAATALIAMCVLVPAVLLRHDRRNWLIGGLIWAALIQSLLWVMDPFATRLHVPGIAKGDIYAATLGWKSLGAGAADAAQRLDAGSIVAETRSDVASLLYYARTARQPIYAWPAADAPHDHFQLTRPLTPAAPMPVLMVTACADPQRFRGSFDQVRSVGSMAVSTGPTTMRNYQLLLLSAPRATTGALPACG